MHRLIVIVVIAATLYGGYWFVGRAQIENRLTEALSELDAGEMLIEFSDLNTRGFPSRFDTTVTDLVIEDPLNRLRWETPIFQLLALSYRPNNVRAYFPEEQIFTIDGETFTLLTQEMEARGQVAANGALTFQQAELELIAPRLRTEGGAELALARFFAAMRLTPGTSQTYDLYIQSRAIELPAHIRRLLDPTNLQPPVIENLRLDASLDLTNQLALNGPDVPVEIAALGLSQFELTWGQMSLTAIGDLVPTKAGVLNGSITFTARNWRDALDLGLSNGMISDDNRFLITGIATNLDETPDFPDTLTLTLTIIDGIMMLGGMALGPAPILR